MDATRARFGAGDPLRALAALSVYVHHVGLWGLFVGGTALAAAAEPYGTFGARLVASLDVGLYLFFVLSGYLIARPFVRGFVEGRPMPATRPYLRRRLLRIAPAFWFVLLLILLRHGSLDASAAELAAMFGFMQTYLHGGVEVEQAIGQAWTLHVELAFYLLVPFTAWGVLRMGAGRLSRNGRVAAVVAVSGAVALGTLAIRHLPPNTLLTLRTVPEILFAFTPGVVLAALETVVPRRVAGARWARAAALGLVAFSAALFTAYAWRRTTGSPAVQGALAAGSAAALVAAPLLLQWSGARCWRVLDNRPLQWLGERSYSFYLVHTAVLWELSIALGAIDSSRTGALVLLPLGLVAGVAVSALTYRYVERPFLALRRPGVPEVAPLGPDGTQPAVARYPAS